METGNTIDWLNVVMAVAQFLLGGGFISVVVLVERKRKRGVSRNPVDSSLELYAAMRTRKHEAMRQMRRVARENRR
jgi:hypothetical protein